jgi:serine phosphatase RsbU (regulator of sigma subunit)
MKPSVLNLNLILGFMFIFFTGSTLAQTHTVDGQYITEWLQLGPFFPDNLETDFLAGVGGETDIDPKEGDTVGTADGQTMMWRLYTSKGNIIVDLLDAYGEREHATIYAFCTLQSETEDDVSIRLRHDDGAVVWINGQQVYNHPTYRELSRDAGVFEAKLKAGENRCLVKIAQDGGPWGFAMRIFPDNQIAATEPARIVVAEGLLKSASKIIWLSDNWKYHPGDDLAWANPEFDDRSWETTDTWLNPNNLPKSGWTGIGWFRLHLAVDATLWGTPLALIVSYQAGASEIYLDGKLIYQFGRVGTNKGEEKAYWEKNPKTISYGNETNHFLAIRYSNFSLDFFNRANLPAGFGLVVGDPNYAVEQRTSQIRGRTSYQMFFTGMSLAFALLHLLLFLFYPRSRGNLYFAIFTVSIATLIFSSLQLEGFSTNLKQIGMFYTMLGIAVILMVTFGVRCAYSLFYAKLPKQFWGFLTVGIALGVWVWYKPPFDVPVYLLLFTLTTFAEMLRVIVVAVLKKKDGAWIIGIGFIALILPMTYLILGMLGVLKRVGELEFVILFPGILGLLISMSVYLARNFARTSKNLETQLIQVKTLSEQTLEQERRAREEEVQRKLLEADNARKTQELDEARRLQRSMLPKTTPSLPNLELAWEMKTANEVGGDYYDFNLAADGTLTVAIGDATGHGLNAGIVVAAAKSLFKASANASGNVQTLEKISQGLRGMNLRRLQMAMTLVTFKDKAFTIAAAGMPPVLIYRAATKSVEELLLEGLPLGSLIASVYQQKTFELQPGDTVLLMSDGLPEMLNPADEMLDYPQTVTIFQAVADATPVAILAQLFQAGEAWANGRPREDDVTFVVMKVK